MRATLTLGAAIAATSVAIAAVADSPFQPPMNSLNYAYYTCGNNGAFLVSYDGNPPKSATITTSNDNKSYDLKRTDVANGAEFSGGGAKFWTDGKAVRVDGTAKTFAGCKLKPRS